VAQVIGRQTGRSMLKGLTREITLAIQIRSGASIAGFVWLGIVALGALTAFVFLCVSGYDWLVIQFGDVVAALIMTGIFAVIALVALWSHALVRRRVRARAILARSAKAHSRSWLSDPKILGVAVEIGRTIGWERLMPLALFGLMATEWAREPPSAAKQCARSDIDDAGADAQLGGRETIRAVGEVSDSFIAAMKTRPYATLAVVVGTGFLFGAALRQQFARGRSAQRRQPK